MLNEAKAEENKKELGGPHVDNQGALKLRDLNDIITPLQACIVFLRPFSTQQHRPYVLLSLGYIFRL